MKTFGCVLGVIWLGCAAHAFAQAGTPTPQPVDSSASQIGAPVVAGGDTLFHIRARLGSFTPAERATAIALRIRRVARESIVRADSIFVLAGETGSDIVAGDVVIMTVSDADALAAGMPRAELARQFTRAIAGAMQQQSTVARMRSILTGVVFAMLVAIAAAVAFRLVRRLFERMARGLESRRATWSFSLHIQRLELLSAEEVLRALLWTLKLLRVVALVLILYLAIPTVLSLFPWTRPYAQQLFGYILTPFSAVWSGILSYLPNVFTIGAIVVVTWYLLKLIRLVFDAIAGGGVQLGGFHPEWSIPTYKLVRVIVLAFAFIMIWPYLPGSDSPAFQGVGVMLGLLISFGSASAIGNVVGGIVLVYMRPFQVGDRVRIADTTGDIVARDLLVTRIRTIKNVEITIPNSMVLGSHIINYSSTASLQGVILHTTVTIGYDAPWRDVHALLVDAALKTDGVLADPAPFVFQTSLDDFYVSYEVNAYSREPGRMAAIYSALHQSIQDRFNEGGIEILSPHYRAARDGNHTTMPAHYLPADYEAPSFRMEHSRGGRSDGTPR